MAVDRYPRWATTFAWSKHAMVGPLILILNKNRGAKPPGGINILKEEGAKRLQEVPWLAKS